MTTILIKQLLDACFTAKKITELMPELPKGMKARHMHIITSIAQQGENGATVRVGDVSGDLKVTMPSITKLINELHNMKIIEKFSISDDKRATALSLTELGWKYYSRYVVRYHNRLAAEFTDLTSEQCRSMIDTIERLYEGIDKIAQEDFHADCI